MPGATGLCYSTACSNNELLNKTCYDSIMVFGQTNEIVSLRSLKGDRIHYIQVNAIYQSTVNIGHNFGGVLVTNIQVDCYIHGCYRQVLTVLG